MNITRKILVVDDSNDNREGVSALLRFMGFDVREACNGEDALKVLERFRPELLLLDVKMPGMSGLQLLEKLDLTKLACAAIVMTGHESVNDASRAMELGAISYLRKPIRVEELSKHIDIAFQKNDEHAAAEKRNVDLEREATRHSRKTAETFRIVEFQSRRFDLILDNMQEPLLAVDNEKRIMMINKAAERAFGINASDVIDRTLAESLPKSALTRFIDRVELVCKTGNGSVAEERIEANGRMYSVSTSRLVLEAETVAGYVMIFTDKTSQYQAEQLRSAFLGIVSHEFKTPLSVLMNVGALLGTKRHCDEIECVAAPFADACSRLTHLVNSVVTFARITNDDTLLTIASVDIYGLLTRAVEKLADAARIKQVAVSIVASDEWPAAATDGELLFAAIDCVLDNAVKFTPQCSRVDVRCFVTYESAKSLHIEVCDEGPGIPPEKIPLVVELFEQGEDPLHRKYGGLGLGLPLAKRAVALLGGDLSIGTAAGGGCRVEITVPV